MTHPAKSDAKRKLTIILMAYSLMAVAGLVGFIVWQYFLAQLKYEATEKQAAAKYQHWLHNPKARWVQLEAGERYTKYYDANSVTKTDPAKSGVDWTVWTRIDSRSHPEISLVGVDCLGNRLVMYESTFVGMIQASDEGRNYPAIRRAAEPPQFPQQRGLGMGGILLDKLCGNSSP